MSTNGTTKTTAAFSAQAWLAFIVSATAMLLGVYYLPMDVWQRSFMGMTGLFVISSAFTLAKVIRDAAESETSLSKADEAALLRLLAERG